MKGLLVIFFNFIRSKVIVISNALIFSKLKNATKVSKILVVRKGTLGDHIVCEPVYNGIKKHFESAEIHLLTSVGKHRKTSILDLPQTKYFDEIYFYEDFNAYEHKKRIKAATYDLVVELPQELDSIWVQIRNMLFFRWAGITHGAGWTPGNLYLFAKWQYFNVAFKRVWQLHAQTLNKAFGIKIQEVYTGMEKYDLDFHLPDDYIVVCPEAKFASKMWAIQNFEALASKLISQGHKVVVLGQKTKLEIPESDNYFNLVGKTNMQELQQVISEAKLFIGNDSGPMHIAYSNRIPVIALFGTRNYPKLWWPPESEKNVVLHQPEGAKRFAFIEKVDSNNRECLALKTISVEEVLKEASKLL